MVLLGCGQPWCVTSSAPPAHLLAAGLTCSACASVGPLQPLPLPSIHPLPHSFPLMSANVSVHNSCAPEMSPHPNCETVAIFLWPANWPFVGCLLRQSLFRFRLLARTVALLLGCRCGLLLLRLRLSVTGGGYLSLFMTASDPKTSYYL